MKNLKKVLAGLILAGISLMILGCGNNATMPQMYKVTYSLGEGVEGTAPADSNLYLTGQTVTLAAAVERSGYTFTAWNDGKADYAAGSSYTMGISNVTFTAQWKKNEVKKETKTNISTANTTATYTVTYSLGEGVVGTAPTDDKKYKSGDKVTLAAAPARANYSFGKWNDGKSDYDAGAEYTMGNANVTFTAKWSTMDQVAIPSFSVAAGVVTSGTTVSITCSTAGATIYYTTDGSTPTSSSTAYSTPVTIDAAMTLKAIAIKSGMTDSAVASADYTVTAATYQFTESVRVLPAGTDGTAGTSATYVEFGDWPQTIMAANVTVDVNDRITMGGNSYFVGSDGNYYAKCRENLLPYNGVQKYSDGTDIKESSANSYRYFKVEPIKWRVLTTTYTYDGTNKAKLLMAESILTANVPYYEDYRNNHRNGKYPNNYEYSQIRAYLNGISYNAKTAANENLWLDKGFLQTAFTATAQAKIKTTKVDNSAASTSDATGTISQATTYKCDDTQDKIFLLSEKEVTTTTYGFAAYNATGAGNTRIRMTTDYAKANYACQSSTAGYGAYFWLRSPHSFYNDHTRVVGSDGHASNDGRVGNPDYGVVPALSISF